MTFYLPLRSATWKTTTPTKLSLYAYYTPHFHCCLSRGAFVQNFKVSSQANRRVVTGMTCGYWRRRRRSWGVFVELDEFIWGELVQSLWRMIYLLFVVFEWLISARMKKFNLNFQQSLNMLSFELDVHHLLLIWFSFNCSWNCRSTNLLVLVLQPWNQSFSTKNLKKAIKFSENKTFD